MTYHVEVILKVLVEVDSQEDAKDIALAAVEVDSTVELLPDSDAFVICEFQREHAT